MHWFFSLLSVRLLLSTKWPAAADPDNIYNVYETALFCHLLPQKTLAFGGDSCTGGSIARLKLLFWLA